MRFLHSGIVHSFTFDCADIAHFDIEKPTLAVNRDSLAVRIIIYHVGDDRIAQISADGYRALCIAYDVRYRDISHSLGEILSVIAVARSEKDSSKMLCISGGYVHDPVDHHVVYFGFYGQQADVVAKVRISHHVSDHDIVYSALAA